MNSITLEKLQAGKSGLLLFKGLLSLLCFLPVALPLSGSALPSKEVIRTYYGDASKTQQVGFSILACQGGRFTQGQVTRHVTVENTPCEGGPGRGSQKPGAPCEFSADTTCQNLPTKRPYEAFR